MPNYVFTGTRTYTARAYTLVSGDSLLVESGANMNGQIQNDTLIRAEGATIRNNGTISNYYDAVRIYDGSRLENYGTITSSFSDAYTVYSSNTSGKTGANTIINYGSITNTSTDVDAIALATFASGNQIVNYGLISQTHDGLSIGGTGQTNLTNYSGIFGDVLFSTDEAINITNAAGATIAGSIYEGDGANSLNNSGRIDGDFFGGGGIDTVVNRGVINGQVDLGSGNDVLVNTGGTVVGNIVGGLGNDTITGGDGRDFIYGDNVSGTAGGNDSIYAGGGNDYAFGGAGNDLIAGNAGNDQLFGNQGNDMLYGGQGDDLLYGGQADDMVIGGIGNDSLYGNLGNDRFVFAGGFGKDVINDFHVVAGDNDVIQFQSGTFANYAAVQGAMAQQGSSVVITLDANDTITLLNTTTAQLTSDHFLFG